MDSNVAHAMEEVGLVPNLADIKAHLYALFSPAFVHPYPEAWVEIAYGHPAVRDGAVDEAQNYSAFEINEAAEFAEAKNKAGFNLYAGVALRQGKQPRSGRAEDDQFLASAYAWAEFDGADDCDRIIAKLEEYFLRPALMVTTGTVPARRAHIYFKVADIKDGAQLKQVNAALERFLGSDNVKNASRVLRLAGTINFPTVKKQQDRGYLTEVTTLQRNADAPLYRADELINLIPAETCNHFETFADEHEGHHGKSDDELMALLKQSRATPGSGWRVPMRSFTASAVGKGWSDLAIKLAAAPYADGGVDDRDVQKLIDTARNSFDKPEGAPADVVTLAVSSPAREKLTNEPLPFINISTWDSDDVPEREWAVRDLIPLRTVFMLSGEGAAGKSLLSLQLGVAHSLERDWLGTLPMPGSFLYFGAEDDADELHRRLHKILDHYQATFADIESKVRLLSFVGEDALLAVTNKSGIVQPTILFGRLLKAATEMQPVNITLDTVADIFGGNEINRSEVRQFIGLLRKLAVAANATVNIVSHPSLTGIASGSGTSGSTGWHNAVRARAYFTTVKRDKDEEPDPDLRLLEFKKNNYGPIAKSIPLRYENGVYKPVGGFNTLDRMAREQTADRLFVALLDRFNDQGRNVTDKAASKTYAPTVFAKEEEAEKRGLRKADLDAAMRRLFTASAIRVEPYGPPSRGTTRLVSR